MVVHLRVFMRSEAESNTLYQKVSVLSFVDCLYR